MCGNTRYSVLQVTIAGTSLYGSKCKTQGTYKCRWPTNYTGISRWKSHDCGCGTRAVQTPIKHGIGTGATPSEGPQNTVSINCISHISQILPQFCKWLHKHASNTMFLHNPQWTNACHTHEATYMTSTTVTLGMVNHYAIHKHEHQGHFNVNVWADITRDTVMVISATIICLATVLLGCLKMHPLAVTQRLWFQHEGDSAHYMKDVWQWMKSTYPGRRI